MSDHGRFIWYELMIPDVAAAKAFYGAVVGWTSQDMDMGPAGSYTLLQADGNGVAGAMDFPAEMKSGAIPPNWTGYVCVDDCDAAAAKTQSLGGSVFRAPEDIPGIGRFAIVADPAGAAFAIMKPTPPEGSPPEVPPNTLGHGSWHELYGGRPEDNFDFYAQMFGWTKGTAIPMGDAGTYQLFHNQDGEVGGMMAKPPQIPAPCWLFYFQVGDIDAAKGRIESAGGQVLNGPMEVPGGAWIVQASDPQGAMFAVVGTKAA